MGNAGLARRALRTIGSINGYEDNWMTSTKKTIEDELRSRGVAPELISEVSSKIEWPSVVGPVLASIVVTTLVCACIFAAIWDMSQ